MKALCPSVQECQGQEVGVGGLVIREKGEGIEESVFHKGNQERENILNVNKENIQ